MESEPKYAQARQLAEQGLKNWEIADRLHMPLGSVRAAMIARTAPWLPRAKLMKAQGYGYSAIAEAAGVPLKTVRSALLGEPGWRVS